MLRKLAQSSHLRPDPPTVRSGPIRPRVLRITAPKVTPHLSIVGVVGAGSLELLFKLTVGVSMWEQARYY